MSDTICLALAGGTVAIGVLALYVGLRGDNMAAKIGGSFIVVIGVLGAIACFLTE
jgi:hypothetical protein